MISARHWLDSPCSAQASRGRVEALLDAVSDELPVVFYGTALTGEALSLGTHQRAALAVKAAGCPTVRRSSGGNTVHAGEGVFHFAVALNNASALMDCPPGRILNRNVRGVLQGLRLLGVPSHYFGRDYVSVLSRPGAYIAWDERDDGCVLFEAFVSISRSYVPGASMVGYPPRNEDPFRGHTPITLDEAAKRAVDGPTLFDHLVRGYAAMYQLDSRALDQATQATCVERAATTESQALDVGEPELSWSPPYEESIGFVYAGVSVAADGTLHRAHVGGDYFQNRRGQRALGERLVGCAVDGTSIGRAINEVYADTRHVIEGIRQMDSLRAVVLSAVERAQTGV